MTNTSRPTFAAAAVGVAACVLLAACGTSSAASAPAAGAASGSVDTPSPSPSDPASPLATDATACALVTQPDVQAVLGTDPGAGAGFNSHGSSQCQYGSFQTRFVLVNLTPTQGKAAYELMHSHTQSGHAVDLADADGSGDPGFEITGPGTASVYVQKGDALILVMVAIHGATAPPVAQALVLVKTAGGRQ